MPRPLVALTATTEIIRGASRARLNEAYVRAIEAAGLVPLASAPLRDRTAAGDLLDRVDGVILTGGEDVDPRRYGASRHPATQSPHDARDEWELALVDAARERRMPALAICRGMQLVNVALGGTLIQDLPSERPGDTDHARASARSLRVHAATVTPGGRLAAIVRAGSIAVNSSHHQAIDRIAGGLTVAARADDGIIEAVETSGDWWVLGVQWHPEELVETSEPWDRAIFAAYATEVQRSIERRSARGLPQPQGTAA